MCQPRAEASDTTPQESTGIIHADKSAAIESEAAEREDEQVKEEYSLGSRGRQELGLVEGRERAW